VARTEVSEELQEGVTRPPARYADLFVCVALGDPTGVFPGPRVGGRHARGLARRCFLVSYRIARRHPGFAVARGANTQVGRGFVVVSPPDLVRPAADFLAAWNSLEQDAEELRDGLIDA